MQATQGGTVTRREEKRTVGEGANEEEEKPND